MKSWHWVVLALLVMVGLGIAIGGDYGISLDEPQHVNYGRQLLRIYQESGDVGSNEVDPADHGPFYDFVAFSVGQWVTALRPGWTPTDGRHFVYYLSFVMATFLIGILLRRYASASVAWLTAALFFSQPLIFGHAFMNPKDIPFMAFFLAGWAFGVLALPNESPGAPAVDANPSPAKRTGPSTKSTPSPDSPKRRTNAFEIFTGVSLLIIGVLYVWGGWLPWLQSVLASAYQGQAIWPVQTLFDHVATDAYKTPIDLYEGKLERAFYLARTILIGLLCASMLLGWGRRAWPKLRSVLAGRERPLLASAAGLMIGLATSIRSIAPLAGVALAVLWLRSSLPRREKLIDLGLMGIVGLAACLATWPFLWEDTLSHYLQSVLTLSQFHWTGIILFNGSILTPEQRPWFYVPELMGLQITLSALFLAGLGLYSAIRWRGGSSIRAEIAVLAVACAVPVLASFTPGTVIYNNVRQFLFTVPIVFILAGLGFEKLFSWVRSLRWRLALGALAVLPGLVGILRLHPYEYIYYNGLAGLGGNVYQNFESDYWCVSERAAIDWVNTHAATGAVIEVGVKGGKLLIEPFARPDLRIEGVELEDQDRPPTLALICDGKGGVMNVLPNAPVLWAAERQGATLSVVKDVSGEK